MSRKTLFLLILLVIIVVGIFLRFYHLDAWLRFANDEHRDLVAVSEIIRTKNLIVIGPQTGIGHFHFGNVFFYLLLPAGLIGGVNPYSFAVTAALFSLATIPLLYLLGRKLVSPKFGLVVAALFAVSFLPVIFGRWSWNPHYLPFFVTLFLVGALMISEENIWWKNLFGAAISGLGLGIVLQLHFLGLVVCVLALYLFVARRMYRRKLWFVLPVFLGVLFLVFLPTLLYDLGHNWQNVTEFVSFLGHPLRNEFHNDIWEQLFAQWKWISLSLYHAVLGKVFYRQMIFRSLIALAVIVSTGWFLVWGVVKKQWRSTWWGLALLILVSVGLGLKSMTEMHLRYLEFLLPVLALWIPYLGYRLWRRYSRAKLIVGVLLFIVLSAQLYTVIVYFWENSRGVVDEPYIELPYVALSQAVDWMAVDAQGPFEIDATPIVGYPDAFQWVAEAHGYSFPAGSPTVIYRLVRADQQEKYTEPSWGRFISEAVVSSIVIKKYERIQEETK